ncbi:MAG: ROK family protein [Erysipelotrichaceae bacterium]|nr:ROK family protein [Erysipelotrichaceae bacterium]
MRFGVDIGGTTVKIGIVDNYKIIDKYSIKTNKDTLFDDICLSIKDYINSHDVNDIDGIGFGIPGNVVDDFIYNMPNVGLQNINLKKAIDKHFPNMTIASNNDANCAALGESFIDGEFKSSYMITLGTGVGGGYVVNGRVINGAHGACGEIGHLYVDPIHEYECTCGLKGCLETVASATGIVRLANKYYDQYKTSLKRGMTCEDVFAAAKENDELGLFVLDLVSKYLANGLSLIAITTDVDCFYIGGGVAEAGDLLLNKVKEYYMKYAHYAVKNTRISLAKLGNFAGMLGAAYLF